MSHNALKRGSLWRRWDPHIHSPGTILNNQFTGEDPWGDYFSTLESCSPVIEAIGLTDYYLLENYEKVVAEQANGRLSQVGLIFPNIEMRLVVTAPHSSPINLHLLIAPDDPEHVSKTKQFLSSLEFKIRDEVCRCTREGLITLGKVHDRNVRSDDDALCVGVTQFKVEIDQFIEKWKASKWIQNNALVAVAGSSNDGTASLQRDSSLSATRQKIERRANIIFSSNPNDRNFWLGKGVDSIEDIIEKYGSIKPCIHGSDAHKIMDVGMPDLDRYCWIKGDLTFETLRQACMEPEHRVFVGPEPPSGMAPSQFIKSVSVNNAPWFEPEEVPLNPGLVGIIGARGSGKTALVEMIAAGGYSLHRHINDRSFVYRARDFLDRDAMAQLVWGDDGITKDTVHPGCYEESYDEPCVQYLSQQFVETLCSVDGPTDELIAEIERVIFDAHSSETRHGTINFTELMDAKAALGRQRRAEFEKSIRQIGNEIAQERNKKDRLNPLREKIRKLQSTIQRDECSRKAMLTEDNTSKTDEFNRVYKATEEARQKLSQLNKQKNALKLLKDHVEQRCLKTSIDELRLLRTRHADAGFEEEEWNMFKTDFVGDVEKIINERLSDTKERIAKLEGPIIPSAVETNSEELEIPSQETLLSDTPLDEVPLNTLIAEFNRLQALIGIDKHKRTQFNKLTKKIGLSRTELKRLETQLEDAEGAQERIDDLMEMRKEDYAGVFEGIIAEETALKDLYQPLSRKLRTEGGVLKRLSVSFRRHVDIEGWVNRGEKLLDLRRTGRFQGHGALLEAAKESLQIPWENGNAETVARAMADFRENYGEEFVKSAPYDREKNRIEYLQWAADISQWIYSTDHIKVTYSLTFDGLDIEQLSPGTRGIVLLLLYLAIDQEDERPLIIDQPEENLDPKSIFDELVDRFKTGKLRRQIIIITHNANLIVNTDADQVIVATCGPHTSGRLPIISYQSGGLEDKDIRQHVCNILEGGENALKERAKRLRVII